ncbi:MAG: WYL domain-containing protein [Gammaproteobacteria bacterium]|nr:WYL domain-containing protein [Gammaproteobacteria bacterium]
MNTPETHIKALKWNTRQRLQYIEIIAFYTGTVSRGDVANTFGISDAAATKDIKLYNQLAPDNLIYKQSVFGFVPGPGFKQTLADLSPTRVLPMIASNLPTNEGPYGDKLLYGVAVDSLPIPARLPDKAVLAEVIRAAKHRRKLSIRYRSLSDRDSDDPRIIEPHSLINTGLRWHIRAYNEETFDFRDFVLSRIDVAKMLEQEAESSIAYDDDWVETSTLRLSPHPGLNEKKRLNLLMDYGIQQGSIDIEVRRALLGYTLQKLSVDTTIDHSLNSNAYQLIVMNRDEVEPFAGWAFL